MQLRSGDGEQGSRRKRTRREVFLSEMDQIVLWTALLRLIRLYYPTTGRLGWQSYFLETMLRIHFLQQWHAPSDPAMEKSLYNTPSMEQCPHLWDLDGPSDETTTLNFRRLPEVSGLVGELFERVNVHFARE